MADYLARQRRDLRRRKSRPPAIVDRAQRDGFLALISPASSSTDPLRFHAQTQVSQSRTRVSPADPDFKPAYLECPTAYSQWANAELNSTLREDIVPDVRLKLVSGRGNRDELQPYFVFLTRLAVTAEWIPGRKTPTAPCANSPAKQHARGNPRSSRQAPA
jgi:hypothetical protein